MEPLFLRQGHSVSSTQLYRGEALPSLDVFDWLIVMGGPMSIHDEREYPWLVAEKAFILKAIKQGKSVLGVCLGAQLIAFVLGAPVAKNQQREIGWFPLRWSAEVAKKVFGTVPDDKIEVFHWHGETFGIPEGALPLASSAACWNQGFVYRDHVIGLQFHLETTPESAQALINNCGNELDGGLFVQTAETILSHPQRFTQINRLMENLIQNLPGAEGRE